MPGLPYFFGAYSHRGLRGQGLHIDSIVPWHTCQFMSCRVCHSRLPSPHSLFNPISSYCQHCNFILPTYQILYDTIREPRQTPLRTARNQIYKASVIMCIKIIERYAVCKCIYYSHSIDACPAYGRRDHPVRTREVLVGYTCSKHSVNGSQSYRGYDYPDSGYASGSHRSAGRNADGSFRR